MSLSILPIIYLILVLIIPIGSLLATSNVENFWSLATEPVALSAYFVTFSMALIASLINGVFGFLLAWVLVRYDFPGKKTLDAAIDLPFALPTSVAGLTLATIYSPQGWIGQLVSCPKDQILTSTLRAKQPSKFLLAVLSEGSTLTSYPPGEEHEEERVPLGKSIGKDALKVQSKQENVSSALQPPLLVRSQCKSDSTQEVLASITENERKCTFNSRVSLSVRQESNSGVATATFPSGLLQVCPPESLTNLLCFTTEEKESIQEGNNIIKVGYDLVRKVPPKVRPHIQLVQTRTGVALAMIFVSFPFVVRNLQPVLQEMDTELEEIAWSLGANSWVTFRKIILPPLLPTWIAGITLSFSRAIGEYGSVVVMASNIPLKDLIASVLVFQKLEQYETLGATVIGTLRVSNYV